MPAPDTITLLLQHYGYFFLFPIAVVEGPIVSVIAAFLAVQGFFNVYVVFGVVVAADIAGDILHYALGRWGTSWLQKWGQHIGIQREQIKKLEQRFETRGGRALIFGKLTHASGFIILIAAGVAKMPVMKFLWYNLISTIPKSLFFILIGYYLGYAYNEIGRDIELATFIISILFIGVIPLYFLKNRYLGHTV